MINNFINHEKFNSIKNAYPFIIHMFKQYYNGERLKIFNYITVNTYFF